MLHYALYCLLTTCDILAMQALVWVGVFWFGASCAYLKQPFVLSLQIYGRNLIVYLGAYDVYDLHYT
jgi:hypothetical protein